MKIDLKIVLQTTKFRIHINIVQYISVHTYLYIKYIYGDEHTNHLLQTTQELFRNNKSLKV